MNSVCAHTDTGVGLIIRRLGVDPRAYNAKGRREPGTNGKASPIAETRPHYFPHVGLRMLVDEERKRYGW